MTRGPDPTQLGLRTRKDAEREQSCSATVPTAGAGASKWWGHQAWGMGSQCLCCHRDRAGSSMEHKPQEGGQL